MQKLLLSQLHTFFLVNMFFHLRSIYCFCWRRKEEEGFHTLAVNIKKDVYNSGWLQKKIGMHLPSSPYISQSCTRPQMFNHAAKWGRWPFPGFWRSDFPCKLHPLDPLILYVLGKLLHEWGFETTPPFSLGYIYIIYIGKYIIYRYICTVYI